MSLPTTWKRWIRSAPMRYRLLIILILKKWLKVMKFEMDSICMGWTLVDPLEGKKNP
jgi:hypothetical protein